jgi:hypothetical protein
MLLLNQTAALRTASIQGSHQPEALRHFATDVFEEPASIRLVALELPSE